MQSTHAVYHLAGIRAEQGTPNIVLIGMPNVKALRRVERKLETAGVPHYSWTEPDNDWGLTAIATAPLRGEQRNIMSNYRVYAPVAQCSASASKAEDVGSSPTGSAMLGCTEASVLR